MVMFSFFRVGKISALSSKKETRNEKSLVSFILYQIFQILKAMLILARKHPTCKYPDCFSFQSRILAIIRPGYTRPISFRRKPEFAVKYTIVTSKRHCTFSSFIFLDLFN